MIAREWKACLPESEKKGFLHYLNETGIKETSCTPGFKGVQVFIKNIKNKVEVTLITYWESTDAIKAFAGNNIGKAKLYPEDYKYKLEPNDFVSHYEVVVDVWL